MYIRFLFYRCSLYLIRLIKRQDNKPSTNSHVFALYVPTYIFGQSVIETPIHCRDLHLYM